jgi:hypothetical protein
MTRCTRWLRNLLSFACLLFTLICDAGHFLLLCLRPSPALAAENLFLRKQLALYQERQTKPRRATKGRRHERPHTRRASETGHRLSAPPGCVEERRGPPRLRDRPLRACSGRTPRRIGAPPRPSLAGAVVAFDGILPSQHLERREVSGLPSYRPHVRMPPHRGPVSRPVPGLLPAQAGSPFAGRDLHPLDDKQSFMKASPPPIPFDQQGLIALYCLFFPASV